MKSTAVQEMKVVALAQSGALTAFFSERGRTLVAAAITAVVLSISAPPAQSASMGEFFSTVLGVGAGGAIGSRFGEGNGKTAMTIGGGVIGGAFGNAVNQVREEQQAQRRQPQYQQQYDPRLMQREKDGIEKMFAVARRDRDRYLDAGQLMREQELRKDITRDPVVKNEAEKMAAFHEKESNEYLARVKADMQQIARVLETAKVRYGRDVSFYEGALAEIGATSVNAHYTSAVLSKNDIKKYESGFDRANENGFDFDADNDGPFRAR